MLYDQHEFGRCHFPSDALQADLYELTWELHRNTKAPWELIFSALLGSMSLACQGAVNVRVPNGISAPSPVSIFVATLMESGGGKTTIDKIISKPIVEFEVRQAAYLKQQRIKYKSAMISWNIKKKAIEKAIARAEIVGACTDQSEEESDDQADEEIGEPNASFYEAIEASVEHLSGGFIDQLKAQLTEHLANEPPRPRNVKLMYNNTSPEAIQRSLFENWPSASLSSDEAGGILNGKALADLAAINKLWEGGTIHVERIDSESFILRNARLTLALMLQPKVFNKYIERHGEEARAIGLFARCFFCRPISSVGTRLIISLSESFFFYMSGIAVNFDTLPQQPRSPFDGEDEQMVKENVSANEMALMMEKSRLMAATES